MCFCSIENNINVKLLPEPVQFNCRRTQIISPTFVAHDDDDDNNWQGVWGDEAAQHVRNITWEVENPRQLVDKYAGTTVCRRSG